MYSKKIHIMSLQANKKLVDTRNNLKPSDRILFVTSLGIIEGTVLKGADIPEEGTPEEALEQMLEENQRALSFFDITKFQLIKEEDPEFKVKVIEAINLKDVIIRDLKGNTYSVTYLLLFTDQIIGCMPIEGQ